MYICNELKPKPMQTPTKQQIVDFVSKYFVNNPNYTYGHLHINNIWVSCTKHNKFYVAKYEENGENKEINIER